MQESKRLLISGGTGFIGKRLCLHLASQGYDLTVLTREPETWRTAPIAPGVSYVSHLKDLDVRLPWYGVVNLAGEPLNNGRWNARRKDYYRHSRVQISKQLACWARQLPQSPEVFVSASAIGWYGHWHDEILDESSTAHSGYTHRLCRDWEAAATEQLPVRCRSCLLRIGIVLGADGGPLPAMLLPARLGLGGPMGTGSQWWSWIHIDDLIRQIQFLLENTVIEGPVNGTSPNPLPQKVFARALGKKLHRPAFLPLPGILAKLILGEFADEILLNGQRVIPAKALNAGFTYTYPEIDSALDNLLS